MPKYWLSCVEWKDFLVDQDNEFAIAGYREQDLDRLLRVGPGDKLVYYLKRLKLFAAICEVRRRLYVDWGHIWNSNTYPCRLETRPLLVLPRERMLPATAVLSQLSLGVRPGASSHQALSLRCAVTEITPEDYQVLEAEMRRQMVEGQA